MADIFELFKKISSENTAPSGPITHVVVGLGNPGAEYLHTRHNAGFLAIDYICNKYNARVNKSAHKALVGEATIGGKRVLLVKPQTYMNLSGESVKSALDFYKIKPENLIVIYDDISLDVGRLRVRRDGSAGGHNGIKSIIANIGTQIFPRIKVGVGQKPHPDYDLASWVLSEFKNEELKALEGTFPTVCEGLEKILTASIDDAMQVCNKKVL
jgi:PTH1 family peptidyl-tRNA hydrolase